MKKVTFFVANSCLNGSSFLILRATQSQNMFTRLQMKSRYSFQGILSSGCYSMIPTHFKNWRKWCAYCKYITPLNNVSFFLLSRKIAKKILFWIIQDISFGVKIQLFFILVLFANWSSLKFTLRYLGTLALEPFTLIGIIKT